MAKEFIFELSESDGFIGLLLLKESISNMLSLLEGVEYNFPAHQPFRWAVVRAQMQSPFRATIAPIALPQVIPSPDKPLADALDTGFKVIDATVEGVREIAKSRQTPLHFDDDTLTSARRLIVAANKRSSHLKIFSPGVEPVPFTVDSIPNIDAMVQSGRVFYEYGSVEGMLEVVSTHKSDHFGIWERLRNRKIKCKANEEQIKQASELLRKRVEVFGKIRYKNSLAQTIEVERIRAFRDRTELTKLDQVNGIDITGGLSTEDYVRSIRDGK